MNQNIFQEDDLLLLRDQLNEALKNLGVKKEKAKCIPKVVVTLIGVGGGVATAILVPGPLTFAILGGLGFLFTRNLKTFNKVLRKSKQRKKLKSQLEEVRAALNSSDCPKRTPKNEFGGAQRD